MNKLESKWHTKEAQMQDSQKEVSQILQALQEKFFLHFILHGKRSKEDCDRGSEDVIVHIG